MIREQLKTTILVFCILTIITGIIYPLAITGIAQLFFKSQANGSIIIRDGKVIGSSLIGQPFDDPGYFWGRPSATSPAAFNAASSSGSNLGPSNQALSDAVKTRVNNLHIADPDKKLPIPVDLVTSSASGLDPHISPAAAFYQIPRIARERKMQEDVVRAIVQENTENRFLGVIGEPVVNVLRLNLAIDSVDKVRKDQK
jgi:K+-transporting ATPase ATPase C chain